MRGHTPAQHFDVLRPAESEARHRADRALFVSVVADRAARAQHDLRELRVGCIAAAEHGAHEFVAADGAFAMLDQALQAFERARRQGLRHAVAEQFASRGIQYVRAEAITHGRCFVGRSHRLSHLRTGGMRQAADTRQGSAPTPEK